VFEASLPWVLTSDDAEEATKLKVVRGESLGGNHAKLCAGRRPGALKLDLFKRGTLVAREDIGDDSVLPGHANYLLTF
jgi:hypothetical protein